MSETLIDMARKRPTPADFVTNVRRRISGNWAHVKMTLHLARGQRGMMAGFIALALLNALTDSFSIMLMVPLLESFSSSTVFGGVPVLEQVGALLQPLDPIERLRWVGGLLFFVILLKGAAQYGLDVIVYLIPQRIEHDLRVRVFQTLMNSKLSYSESFSMGEISNLSASFPARVGISARFLSQFVGAGLTVLLMLAVVVAITPGALLGLGIFGVLTSIMFKMLTGPLSRRLDSENTTVNQQFSQIYFEALNNKRNIRVFNATEAFLGRIVRRLDDLRRIQVQTILVQNATYPFFATLAGGLICGMVLIASYYRPDHPQALLGFMLVFLVAATRILAPFSIMHISRMHYAIHADAVTQLGEFLVTAARHRDPDGSVALPKATAALRFEEVTFGYDSERSILKDLSFEVKPGEFLAIVGRSGAGKSTIFGLLTRLHRPDRGRIQVADVDLDDVEVRTWWDCISFVSQDVPVFNSSVSENILFGSSEPLDHSRLEDALRLSAADSFVARLPEGLETRLGEFGSVLSGGERQRLALARAFYHRRPLILLDEVTSQLDAATEQRITTAIDRLKADGHTILAIAHRPSTIRKADRILVLDDGQISATGSHDNLLQENTFYRDMATA